jgi:RimJ/RimL family protein N-acetyltransferase
MAELYLRAIQDSDLDVFYEQQADPEANRMAAFPAREREAFLAHWRKNLANARNTHRTIVADGQVAGNIVSYEMEYQREVGYWLGRAYWGKGIATEALAQFLRIVIERPLYAHVAKHNVGSKRVLEKCGFTICGEDKVFSDVHGEVIEELVLKLV